MLGLALVVVGSLDEDRAECTDKLVGLVTCLPYVGGDAKTPTVDCCTGLKEVVKSSNKCLCVLIKDRDDPNLGIKLNSSLALNLPNACHVPTNITKCIGTYLPLQTHQQYIYYLPIYLCLSQCVL